MYKDKSLSLYIYIFNNTPISISPTEGSSFKPIMLFFQQNTANATSIYIKFMYNSPITEEELCIYITHPISYQKKRRSNLWISPKKKTKKILLLQQPNRPKSAIKRHHPQNRHVAPLRDRRRCHWNPRVRRWRRWLLRSDAARPSEAEARRREVVVVVTRFMGFLLGGELAFTSLGGRFTFFFSRKMLMQLLKQHWNNKILMFFADWNKMCQQKAQKCGSSGVWLEKNCFSVPQKKCRKKTMDAVLASAMMGIMLSNVSKSWRHYPLGYEVFSAWKSSLSTNRPFECPSWIAAIQAKLKLKSTDMELHSSKHRWKLI